jgi:hypothetical protein
MRMMIQLILCLGMISLPSARPSPTPEKIESDPAMGEESFFKESLDQKRIHDLYNNGDFDPVISLLEGFKNRNTRYSISDSVFIAKHLAVVYSANPATREKGRYYMMRLLELLPSAKLVDMYVSEEVDRIFDKVREEFLARQRGFGLDSSSIVLPHRPKGQNDTGDYGHEGAPKSQKGWNRPRNWVIGGLTMAAVGAIAYIILENPNEKSPTREVVIPKN